MHLISFIFLLPRFGPRLALVAHLSLPHANVRKREKQTKKKKKEIFTNWLFYVELISTLIPVIIVALKYFLEFIH